MSGYLIVLAFGFGGLVGLALLAVISDGSRMRKFDAHADAAIDLTGGAR